MFFCFGIGYTAEALLTRLIAEGETCAGTCRTLERQAELRARGIGAVLFDSPEVAELLAGSSYLLSSVPPDESGDPVLGCYGDLIDAHAELDWVGYLSTTGVYGDTKGEWVDETAPLKPPNLRLERRVKAEEQWMQLHRRHALPVHIFRLSGIYGPRRNAIEQVRMGEARRIDKPGQYFSRIHVADIVETLVQSMHHTAAGEIYNVCDDEPAPPQNVVEYACHLLGLAPPPLIPFEQAELSEMARSFYQSNRRVSNHKIRENLGVKLNYPSYREGLEQLLADHAKR